MAGRLHITAYAGALEALRESALRRLPVELTSWWGQLPEEVRYQKDVGEQEGEGKGGGETEGARGRPPGGHRGRKEALPCPALPGGQRPIIISSPVDVIWRSEGWGFAHACPPLPPLRPSLPPPRPGEALARVGLFYMPDLDLSLAKVLASPRYQVAADFALHLVQACCVVDPILTAADLAHTLDVLAKLAVRVSGGHSVLQLVEEARRVSL